MRQRGLVGWWVLGLLSVSAGCGGDEHAPTGDAGGASARAGAAGTQSAGKGQGAASGRGGTAGGEAASGQAGSSGEDTGGAAGEPALAAGGASGARDGDGGANGGATDDELGNIYNLVDVAAEAELEAVLTQGEGMPRPLSAPGDMVLGVNGFLERYLEDYDFVFLITDHDVSTNTYGIFEPVNSNILVGTGNDMRWRVPGYKTNGRLKGVAAFKYVKGGFGPFGHELLHHWANDLDPSFGFGVGLDFNSPAHWGYADVHGQLGGFDPAAFHCETPAGASPPACDAATAGRYRYVTPLFGQNANGVSIPYSPFELYLMGLVPRTDAPAEIHVLQNAKTVSHDATNTTVEADGVATVTLDAIVARHGEVSLLRSDERAFKLAMVVVSKAPAPPDVLAEIAHWNAIFGNRASDALLPSFEKLTGGRATLDTRLGPRRTASDPPPEEVPLPNCDLIAQDCGDGIGCYGNGQQPLCALQGPSGVGEPCDGYGFDCARGLDCRFDKAGTSTYCSPYCDPEDPSSPIYCQTLCPDYIVLGTSDGKVLAGACRLK